MIVPDGDGSVASLPAAEAAAGEAAAMASVATVRERFSRRSAAQTKRADSREVRQLEVPIIIIIMVKME